MTLWPLREVKEAHLKKLCKVLWDWEYCNQCKSEKPCRTSTCPGQRSKRLESFFDFYRTATARYIPEKPAGGRHALRSHDDLFDIIQLLKEKPDVLRSLLTKEHFSRYPYQTDITDQHRAFNLAIQVMVTVNCSIRNPSLDGLELGSGLTVWDNDKSLDEFIETTFPTEDPAILHENGGPSDIRPQLNAAQLRKDARIKFQGTDELNDHLKLDQNTGVVQLYHHTTFLKENLLATRDCLPVSDTVRG